MSYSEFKDRLKMVVKKNGGNKYIATKAGMPLGTLSKYVTGISEPTLSNLRLLADTCEVSIDWLVYGGDMNEATRPIVNQTPLDKKTLADAIEVLETALNENGSTLPPKPKAEALMLAYEILLEDEDGSDSNKSTDFKSFLKLVS